MQTPLDPAVKKAYEVSYALFRVAATLPSRSFAELLEKEALNLLRSVVGNFQPETQNVLGIIHYLIAFGKDTDNIHQENASVLTEQIESLASLLRDRASNSVTPADLSAIFSVAEKRVAESHLAESVTGSTKRPIAAPTVSKSAASSMPLSDRQNIILNKIRQSGNCRTRDLQEILPDLSERTLRYDLQNLIKDNKIERGGGGGPASWYKIKEPMSQSNVSGSVSL